MLALKPSTLRVYADRTGASPHGRSGKERRWTQADICTVLTAQRLVDLRGFTAPIASQFAREMATEFVRLTADEGAEAYLLAWPREGNQPGYRTEIVHDAKAAFDAFGNGPLPLVISVRPYIRDALITILTWRRKQAEADQDGR